MVNGKLNIDFFFFNKISVYVICLKYLLILLVIIRVVVMLLKIRMKIRIYKFGKKYLFLKLGVILRSLFENNILIIVII